VYYRSGTVDVIASGQQADALATGKMLHVSCTLTRWQQFSTRNDVMTAILKVWSQIKNLTPSTDAYLLENNSCQILSRSDFKWQSLRLFWRAAPNKNNNNKMSSDMRSVPDPITKRGCGSGSNSLSITYW